MLNGNPKCPNLHTTKEAPGQLLGVFLESVRQNAAGDHLFECLACGYQCVWRSASNTFEQPSWWQAKWQAPVTATSAGEPAQAPQTLAKPVIDPIDLQVHQPAQVPPPAPEPAPVAAPVAVAVAEKHHVEESDPNAVMSIKDAATVLGIKPSALLARVKAGEVPTVEKGKGKVQFVPQSWVDAQ